MGIYVACSVADSSAVIHIEPFMPGMAPAILMNDTKVPIKFRQIGIQHGFEELPPGQMKAFTWTSFASGIFVFHYRVNFKKMLLRTEIGMEFWRSYCTRRISQK